MPVQLTKLVMSASVTGAPDRLEPPADRQILETKTEPHRLHTVLLERVIPDSLVILAKERVIQSARRARRCP
jgi:hypothetical protein